MEADEVEREMRRKERNDSELPVHVIARLNLPLVGFRSLVVGSMETNGLSLDFNSLSPSPATYSIRLQSPGVQTNSRHAFLIFERRVLVRHPMEEKVEMCQKCTPPHGP